MKFKDNFYRINSITVTEGNITASIQIDAQHAIYGGHFPGNPVTPGVVQLEITKELIAEGLQREVALVNMSNCKYLSVLNPEETPEIEVVISYSLIDSDTCKTNVVWSHPGGNVMKASGVYRLD